MLYLLYNEGGGAMLEKITEVAKQRDLVVPRLLFFNYKKINLTEQELIFVIYLINSSLCFDLKRIVKELNISSKDVLKIINTLTEKDLMEIKVEKNSKLCSEKICLDKLYNKLTFLLINKENKKAETNLFSVFEEEFGRTISPMEYEIINAWKEVGFTDELIVAALKEATYNGVSNLRYIDKILHEWKKKGINSSKDVLKDKQNFNKKNFKNVELIDYDWLNDND